MTHFSVQSNHVHALVEGDDVQSLSRGMQGLGVSIAKRINRVTGRRGRVFDDRFFARALRTPREVGPNLCEAPYFARSRSTRMVGAAPVKSARNVARSPLRRTMRSVRASPVAGNVKVTN